jgi:predicted methyltransferase
MKSVTAYAAMIAVACGVVMVPGPTLAAHHTIYERAVNNPERSEADRARDEGRKPAQIMEYYGVEPGMIVVDAFSSDGYYTTLLSSVVGSEGRVIAHNSTRTTDESKAELEAYFAPLGNVDVVVSDLSELSLPDNSVDRVFLFLIYHHLHLDPESAGRPAAAEAIYNEIKRVLKPGGIFGVIEHEAIAGSSRAQSAAWHRAPAATAIADITSAGFIFAGSSDILVNPDDDRAHYWREGDIPRGFTSRWVHTYRKPG